MKEIRFHGRGGQGAVTAAELVAQAAIASDQYAQGFPNFGAERRGAPVMAFLRVSPTQIFLRERIDTPDVVVVLDHSLLGLPEITQGLAPGNTLIINASPHNRQAVEDLAQRYRLAVVDASRIAAETIGMPIANTAIIGALVRATGIVALQSLHEPFRERFGKRAEQNLEALHLAHDQTVYYEAPAVAEHSAAPPPLNWEEYLRGEALQPWPDVEIGCDVHRPGSSREFATGNWRTAGRPVLDQESCIACGICWISCPEMAMQLSADGTAMDWDTTYCKGCGICVAVCPKDALSMEDEA